MIKYVIGNWKLNPATLADATALAHAISLASKQASCHIGCCPTFLHLGAVKEILKDSSVWVGAQDVCAFGKTGAFTGDVSATQVVDMGANFTLIGHSERRSYHGETNVVLADKIRHAIDVGLVVVLCIGETKTQYDQGETLAVLDEQLSVLHGLDVPKQQLLIAYEPVWAIGTGLTPTVDEVAITHRHIKANLASQGIDDVGVLYGGSVNDNNAKELATCEVIDGALVGGASLKAESFSLIAQAFS
ncbi:MULTISPECIES: triose-phosphate isomerase [unclassified Moraxella]|uniref:triose-phosphate isomerase n=1 Tax=unclassified Moraxella TaxID=2685852 RepID=UPI00359D0327